MERGRNLEARVELLYAGYGMSRAFGLLARQIGIVWIPGGDILAAVE